MSEKVRALETVIFIWGLLPVLIGILSPRLSIALVLSTIIGASNPLIFMQHRTVAHEMRELVMTEGQKFAGRVTDHLIGGAFGAALGAGAFFVLRKPIRRLRGRLQGKDVDHTVEEDRSEERAQMSPKIIEEGVYQNRKWRRYENGDFEAETLAGFRRFADLEEFKRFIA